MNLQELLAKAKGRPWQTYEPSEQNEIKQHPELYVPKKPVLRISGVNKDSGYIGLLFKAHPNDDDPTVADAELIAYAVNHLEGHLEQIRQLREACANAKLWIEQKTQCAGNMVCKKMDAALKMSEPKEIA